MARREKKTYELTDAEQHDLRTNVLPFQTLEHIDEPRTAPTTQESLLDNDTMILAPVNVG